MSQTPKGAHDDTTAQACPLRTRSLHFACRIHSFSDSLRLALDPPLIVLVLRFLFLSFFLCFIRRFVSCTRLVKIPELQETMFQLATEMERAGLVEEVVADGLSLTDVGLSLQPDHECRFLLSSVSRLYFFCCVEFCLCGCVGFV